MNGMHYETGYAYNFDSDYHTVSHHWELAPTSSIVELSLTQYFEMDDEASVQLGIKRVEFLDSDGVTRHRDQCWQRPRFKHNRYAQQSIWVLADRHERLQFTRQQYGAEKRN